MARSADPVPSRVLKGPSPTLSRVTTNHATPYASDTAVRPDGAGRWRAELTDRWKTGNKTPNGGYLLATVPHALAADMPLPHPLVASATFLRPAIVGPAQISTEVLPTAGDWRPVPPR